MKGFPPGNKLLLIPIIAAVITALLLLVSRVLVEIDNENVSFIMEYSDIESLAATGGYGVEEALAKFQEIGLSAVFIRDSDDGLIEKANTVKEAGLKVGVISDSGGGEGYIDALNTVRTQVLESPLLFCPLFIAEGNQSGDTLELVGQYFFDMTYGLVENPQRTGAQDVPGLDTQSYTGNMTKVFKLYDEYRGKYGVLGYPGAEEIENIIFRAVTDRSIRIVWLAPFLDNGEIVYDLVEYNAVIDNIQDRIAMQGLSVSGGFSSIVYSAPNYVLLFIIYMGLGALAVTLLKTLINLPRFWDLALFLLWSMACALVTVINPVLLQKAMAFAASVLLPSFAAYFLTQDTQRRLTSGDMTIGSTIKAAVKTFVKTLCIALLGGMLVGAILSDSRFLLELDMFSGVKLSQLLPLLYGALIIYLSLYKGIKIKMPKLKKSHLVILLLLIAAALLVFIARSGDGMLSASVLEQRFRNWLEKVLYARPRTKEMLVAFPALIVAVYLVCRKKGAYLWAFLFVSCIGFVSLVNTFCHIRAPFLQSVIRTGIGAGIGLAVGILAIFIIEGASRGLKGKLSDEKKE